MSRPEPLALLVCDAAVVDAQAKVSLHGLFDVVWATGFPARHARFAIFFKARCERSTAVRVVVEAPDGAPIAVSDPIALEGPGLAQAIHELVGIEFPQAGHYRVAVLDGEGPVAATAIDVRVRQ